MNENISNANSDAEHDYPEARADQRYRDAYESVGDLLRDTGENSGESFLTKDYPTLLASHAHLVAVELYGDRIANGIEGIAKALSSMAARSDVGGMSKEPAAPAFSIEDTAHQTANELLMDAVDAIGVIIPPHVDSPAAAILIVGHALVAKLDSMESTHLYAMNDLRESVDFIAASHDAGEVPTKQEREIMYRALEADMLENCPPEKIEEMDAALLRFKKIAGL